MLGGGRLCDREHWPQVGFWPTKAVGNGNERGQRLHWRMVLVLLARPRPLPLPWARPAPRAAAAAAVVPVLAAPACILAMILVWFVCLCVFMCDVMS